MPPSAGVPRPSAASPVCSTSAVCRGSANKNLTDIAHEAGYFDQPHMVRDFRLFTDQAPEDFLRNASPRNLPTFYK